MSAYFQQPYMIVYKKRMGTYQGTDSYFIKFEVESFVSFDVNPVDSVFPGLSFLALNYGLPKAFTIDSINLKNSCNIGIGYIPGNSFGYDNNLHRLPISPEFTIGVSPNACDTNETQYYYLNTVNNDDSTKDILKINTVLLLPIIGSGISSAVDFDHFAIADNYCNLDQLSLNPKIKVSSSSNNFLNMYFAMPVDATDNNELVNSIFSEFYNTNVSAPITDFGMYLSIRTSVYISGSLIPEKIYHD